MADGDREREPVEAMSSGGGAGLSFESLTDDRYRWDTGGLGGDGCPHHGGRAAASTTHAGHDRVDAAVPQVVREAAHALLLVAAVEVAELLVADDVDLTDAAP